MHIHTRFSLTALAVAGLALSACQPRDEVPTIDMTALQQEAQGITGEFVGTLLPTLQQAMQTGGPVNAIEVCSVEAPAIAEGLADRSGWDVRRVSLQPRNQQLAGPDAWEREVLQQFEQRQQAGESGAGINIAAVVDGQFRYMQAQPTGQLCLTCHGTDLSTAVRAALDEYYPDDSAVGYLEGEIRGAISLRKRNTVDG